jgi:hypothetical protein
MSDVINQAIREVKGLSQVKKSNLSDDHCFGIVCYKYFFNDGEYENTTFRSTYCDGPNDGGIDLIALNEDSDGSKNLILIQSKNQAQVSKTEVKDMFTKMARTVQDFESNSTASFNTDLKRIYHQRSADIEDETSSPIELVVFLGLNKSEDEREKIEHFLLEERELQRFTIRLHYQTEIELQIDSINQGPRYVNEGVLKIYKDHGKIEFDQDKHSGILVNARALSIKNFYERYKNQGLFEQNYRYYIKNDKIDGPINKSLQDKRDKFWFLNNGIIIACEQFISDGDNIKLYNFSIVNGCQTTSLIGKYKGKEQVLDFPIACKIIMPSEDSKKEDFFAFSSEIAEASNSQKAINDRDLKANNPEQKNLQRFLETGEPPIFMEIKRGSNVLLGKKGLEDWQKIKNEQLGQLILAFLLQKPGTARSQKRSIWSNKTTYSAIFRNKNRDRETLVDLLKLSSMYKNWLDKRASLEDDEHHAADNGKFFVLAVIAFLISFSRGQISKDPLSWQSELANNEIDGKFLKDDYNSDALDSLFNLLVTHLNQQYKNNINNFSAFANVTKLDSNYFDLILRSIQRNYLRSDFDFSQIKNRLDEVFII